MRKCWIIFYCGEKYSEKIIIILQKGVQKLQVSEGGSPSAIVGGSRRDLGLGLGPRFTNGNGNGLSEQRGSCDRWLSPGTLRKSCSTSPSCTTFARSSGPASSSSEAFSERWRQWLRSRRVYLGTSGPQARSGEPSFIYFNPYENYSHYTDTLEDIV